MSAAIAGALARTTIAATAACAAAWMLLKILRVESPRVHRLAWALAVMQGWAFLTWTVRVPGAPERTPAARIVDGGPAAMASNAAIVRGPAAPLGGLQDIRSRLGAANLLVAVWIGGMAATCALGVWRYVRVLRALPRGTPAENNLWRREWRRQVRSAGLKRPVRVHLRMTEQLGPLLYWAPWTYLVLAPRALWSAISGDDRESILRHELAHLRRRDLQKSVLVRIAALPQWFNPLVRLAVRRFDEAGEWACDDAAAKCSPLAPREDHLAERDGYTCGRLAFAKVLLAAADVFTCGPSGRTAPPPGAQPLRGGVLARRVQRLVTPQFKEESKMKKSLIPALLAAAVVYHFVRIERVAAEPPPTPAANATPMAAPATERKAPHTIAEWMQKPRDWKDEDLKSAYIVEPPDVLSIQYTAKTSGRLLIGGEPEAKALLETKPAKYLVHPDGKIHLGAGNVYVAGLTVAEVKTAVEATLDKRYDDPQATVEVASYNSKVAYLIVDRDGVGDVTRLAVPHPGSQAFNVGSALEHAEHCSSSELAAATIEIRRLAAFSATDEDILLVAWDGQAGGPTPETNHPLLAGDRLFVKLPPESSRGDRKPNTKDAGESAPTSAPPPTSPALPERPQAGARQVLYDILIVEDARDSMAEFEGLETDGETTADAAATLAAVRMLEKHQLVSRIAEPRLVTTLGRTARLAVVGDLPTKQGEGRAVREETRVEISAVEQGDALAVSVAAKIERCGKRASVTTTATVSPGHALIARLRSQGKSDDRPIYLIATPTTLN
jgi:beta-lactamase regulating signal transducer with metallopeptidase domain